MITPLELDKILTELLEFTSQNDYQLFNSIHFLYVTGCRSAEINLNKWSIDEDGIYTLVPCKHNNERKFLKEELPSHFIKCYEVQDISSYMIPYSSIKRGIQSNLLGKKFKIGKKYLHTHIFRHNYAKKLRVNGYSNEEIKEKMGEKYLSSAMGYIHSDIYME